MARVGTNRFQQLICTNEIVVTLAEPDVSSPSLKFTIWLMMIVRMSGSTPSESTTAFILAICPWWSAPQTLITRSKPRFHELVVVVRDIRPEIRRTALQGTNDHAIALEPTLVPKNHNAPSRSEMNPRSLSSSSDSLKSSPSIKDLSLNHSSYSIPIIASVP